MQSAHAVLAHYRQQALGIPAAAAAAAARSSAVEELRGHRGQPLRQRRRLARRGQRCGGCAERGHVQDRLAGVGQGAGGGGGRGVAPGAVWAAAEGLEEHLDDLEVPSQRGEVQRRQQARA